MTRPDAAADHLYLQRAVELAARGWGRVSPNPLVGAVVVRGGEVVGEGWHAQYGGPHAEVDALRAAGDAARGATLYVTLEPCSHHGKTPPCTDAVLAAGIRRVVYANADPNPRARGGAALLQQAGVETRGGVEATAARDLDPAFFHAFAAEGATRPWTELKLALSLDARVADHAGRSMWITGPEAREEVHRLRVAHDAVAVGIGTVLADDPLLTVRGSIVPRQPPVRVVFDGDLRLPLESRLVRSVDEAPVCVVCRPAATPQRRETLEERGVRVIPAAGLNEGMRRLREAGIVSLLCEGGARLASALLSGELVDRLTAFYAPVLLGPDASAPFRRLPNADIGEVHRWRHLRTERFGSDTLICLSRR